MSNAWDAFNPSAPPRRRIRGEEIPAPSGAPWREQRRAARAQEAQARAQAEAAMTAEVDGPRPVLRYGPFELDLDGVFGFALLLPLLFIAQWGSMSAAMVAGLAPIYVFLRRKDLLQMLRPRLFLLLIPAFFMLSALWSEAKAETLRYAVQYSITIAAGLLLASARDQYAVLRGMALAFLAYVAASLALGGSVIVGVGAGGYAFSGLGQSKNVVADIASTGMMISLGLLFMSLTRKKWLWALVALAAMPLDLYTVVAARSAGALLGMMLGVMAMLSLATLVWAGRTVRMFVTGSVAICLFAAGLSYRWIAQTMIDVAARTFDKDPTLTGRTYLWYRAAELIHEKAALGRGYYAFWLQGNLDAEGLWRYFGILDRGGFNFHNTGVELLVEVGWVGAILAAAVVIVGLICLVARFVKKPDLALVCWISLLLYQLSRTPIEVVGMVPFYFSTALMFGALGAAFGATRTRGAQAFVRAPPQTARIVEITRLPPRRFEEPALPSSAVETLRPRRAGRPPNG